MLLVSRRPEVFRTAENVHNECGAYQLRAVLNAFGKDAPVEELYHSPAHRKWDWSLPWLMPNVLARYGIRARWHFWSRAVFRNRVVEMLARDMPILIVINSIRGNGRLHWISAWGYDSATDEFLCYDSQAPEVQGTPGNARYAADLITSQLPWQSTFALTIRNGPPH